MKGALAGSPFLDLLLPNQAQIHADLLAGVTVARVLRPSRKGKLA